MQQDYNVFISYRGAGSGGLLGKEIYTDLKNAYIEKGQPKIVPFFAPACIEKGENFKEAIGSAISNVSCVILILSKGFFEGCNEKDDMIFFELKEALKNPKITFVPVIMEDFSFEEELSVISDIFSEEEIFRFKHINAINHHGIYDFNTEQDVLPIIIRILANGMKHSTEKKKNNKTPLVVVSLCAFALLALILVLNIFNGENFKGQDGNVGSSSLLSSSLESNQPSQSSEPVQNNPSSSSEVPPSSETAVKPIKGTNQIPKEYENQIDALKNVNSMVLSLYTLNVKVGEKTTPMAADTWENATIYSQDTGIAVGEGLTVKGVAKGETYVIVESKQGSTLAYYVIVE